jgi:hypothetical protein
MIDTILSFNIAIVGLFVGLFTFIFVLWSSSKIASAKRKVLLCFTMIVFSILGFNASFTLLLVASMISKEGFKWLH